MKVLVCGGRHYDEVHVVDRVLDELHFLDEGGPITTIITGGARGADRLAEEWARAHGVRLVIYPADWNKHGKRAGVIRNRAMLKEKPDMVQAFPGGSGTSNMIAMAKKAGIPVSIAAERTGKIKRG